MEIAIGALAVIFGCFWKWRKAMMDREDSELERQQEVFKKIYNFYSHTSKIYALEVGNIYCELGYWEEEEYIEGVLYTVPVTSIKKSVGNFAIPEDSIYQFELNYPELYKNYELLISQMNSLKKVSTGGVGDEGSLTASARGDIYQKYHYFFEIKKELDGAFDTRARELKIRC